MNIDSPRKLRALICPTKETVRQIAQWRTEIENILRGTDPRLLIICGPCSVHNTDEALSYAKKLKVVADHVQDSLYIVMRAFVEKSRTSTSWQGISCDPYLTGANDIQNGIVTSRKFLLDAASLGIPTAMEFVHPNSAAYFEDLIAYGIIGARSVTSSVHRELASALSMPVGFKNALSGDVSAAIHAATVAKEKQIFLHANLDGKIAPLQSLGNIFPHIILRGGDFCENYSTNAIQEAHQLLKEYHLPTAIIVDASHGNSKKDPKKQEEVFCSLIEEKLHNPTSIKGIMLESYHHEGSQSISPYTPPKTGLSITDPCLSWEKTEKLLLEAFEKASHIYTKVCT